METNDFQTASKRTMRIDDGYYLSCIEGISEDKLRLLNAALGLPGEAGEFADQVKKVIFQGHELDREKLKGELGDIAFYIVMACVSLNIDFEEVLIDNVKKLRKRFPNGFTQAASIARVDVGSK
jgi:NTP pyrophosphatase (non-canonical NTP hydrolase)